MLELTVVTRTLLGKKNKRLRREQLLPGVIYGRGMSSLPVSVPYKDFERIFEEAGESTLVKLNVQQTDSGAANGDEATVLIHEPSLDPLSRRFLHVDFYKVRLDQKIKISLPLEYIGSSPAVNEAEGVLVKNFHEIEVEGYPQKLPKEIVVDISRLKNFEDTILIKDLARPEGIEILEDPEAAVAVVQRPRSEAELEALEAAPEESVEGIEVVGKEAKEEETGEEEEVPPEEEKEEK